MKLPARLRGPREFGEAEIALVGAHVLNVFTRSVVRADVGIAGGRIAWVGSGSAARSEAIEGIIVPGLIDPHAHGDIVSTPIQWAAQAVRHGTTACVLDIFAFAAFLPADELPRVMDAIEACELKVLWGLRPSRANVELSLESLFDRPGAISSGELTAFRALLDGEPRATAFVRAAIDAGLRIDGHLPGASPATLEKLAYAGVTSDHEAITGDELQARIEVGMWAMLRHSSMRPDGETLAREVVARGLPQDRLMLTADGVTPPDMMRGHMDEVVRQVIAGGVDPIDAVRMATLHPAIYLGLDAHLGAVAPGRSADLLVVDSLEEFIPRRVMADGAWLNVPPADPIDWAAFTAPIKAGPLSADTIVRACDVPIRLHGPLARAADEPGPVHIALVSRDGTTITGANMHEFDVPAVATTITAGMDVLLIGRDPAALARLYTRVVELGGALACPGMEIPLPVFGHLSPAPLPELAAALERFATLAGLPDGPPFSYRSTFLTLPALPGLCLTPDGILDVRAGAILTPSKRLVDF
jgi:adenine deaminase